MCSQVAEMALIMWVSPQISSNVSGSIKNNQVEGFTRRYGVHILVWYEIHDTMESAISREKTLNVWKRDWKLTLIEEAIPGWHDLYDELA